MFQARLELRTLREQRVEQVIDADGVGHGAVKPDHTRPLTTIFGAVEVSRLAHGTTPGQHHQGKPEWKIPEV